MPSTLRVGRRSRSGNFLVYVARQQGQPVTKYGCNHRQFDPAWIAAEKIRLTTKYKYTCVITRDGRVLWDSVLGDYRRAA